MLPVLAKEPVYPDYKGFVNDFAGVIDASTRQKMEGLCQALEKKTSAELAIVAVNTVEPLDSKEYAVKLFEKWKIGKKGKDNGILILLAMEEKRIEIEVGYGLEGVIPDAQAGGILDKYAVPFFKEGKFGEGLYSTATALADRIAKDAGRELDAQYRPVTPKASGMPFNFDNFTFLSVIAIIIFTALSAFFSGLIAGIVGGLIGAVFGFILAGPIGAIIGAIIGFVLSYAKFPKSGRFSGGGFGGGWSGGGGFGGFGGGRSGGGGAGRSW